jgi:hypothetical protein
MSSSIPARVEADSKPVCLMILKFQLHWNHHLIKKFSIAYRVEILYVHDIFLREGSEGLRDHLQNKATETRADVLLFDLDYYYLFDFELIRSVRSQATRVLVCFDDLVLHQINSINAASCDLVLTADPLSVLKYREIDIGAEYFVLEASKEIYFDRNVRRDIDVLFFGSLEKADRGEFVGYLASRGIDVRVIGAEQGFVPASELADFISRSRIVVNFSKTDFSETTDLGIEHVRQYSLQLKGRVIEAGLCGAACVSEYSPSLRLLFSEQEVPTFHTQEECFDLLSTLLDDDEACHGFARRLHDRVTREFEDSVQIRALERSINQSKSRKPQDVTAPLWYWRLAARSKIKILARSPRSVLRELRYVMRARKAGTAFANFLLFSELCLWIPWHYAQRVVAKFGR